MTIIVDTAGAGAGGIRRAGADPRQLGRGRHPSVHQALRARRVPQPGLRRRQHHVGLDGAGERPAHGAFSPSELAPVDQNDLEWPKWGQYYETHGMSGEAPDMPEAKQLMALLDQWGTATDDAARADVWEKMLSIYTDQVYTIGTVAAVPAAGRRLQPAAQCPARRNLELRRRATSSASTGPISSGSTRRPSRIPPYVPLCRPTPGDHDPDPAPDQLPGLRRHPGAARATISPPISRSCGARARRSIPRASPPSAPNTGSTSPSSCNT